ncbi:MAG: hypothetical protein DRP01_00790 [Archaeoglobales archaeon]|nr:MAG: hypothetical protein DRP01_00790 [Archaeoglobales archaeon]
MKTIQGEKLSVCLDLFSDSIANLGAINGVLEMADKKGELTREMEELIDRYLKNIKDFVRDLFRHNCINSSTRKSLLDGVESLKEWIERDKETREFTFGSLEECTLLIDEFEDALEEFTKNVLE